MTFEKYKNLHKDERCFIIGSGPSLLEEDLSLLENERVMICNKGWELENLGLKKYDYYFLCDHRIAHNDDIINKIKNKVKADRFYHSSIKQNIKQLVNPEDLILPISSNLKHIRDQFPNSYYDGWKQAASVVINMIVVAFFMGFSKIYLLGVDCNYDDPNLKNLHFYKDDEREKKWLKEHKGANVKGTLNTLKSLDRNLKQRGCSLINLSSGFKHKDCMKTDILNKIL